MLGMCRTISKLISRLSPSSKTQTAARCSPYNRGLITPRLSTASMRRCASILRRRQCGLGSRAETSRYAIAATECGEGIGTPLSQKKDPSWVANLPWQSEDLTASYTSRREAEKQAILLELARKQYAKRGKFTTLYKSYMVSAEWQAKRALVLKRCGCLCEGCGTAKAVEVHHITYRHFGSEFLFELLGLCRACHDRITQEKYDVDE